MHNISPTSPVLGDPLQLFPAQPRLHDVCLKVTSPGVFWCPLLSLALRVPCQGLSRNVTIGLSQGVAKLSPSCLKNVYLYLNLVCSLPEVLVADFVHPLDSQNFPQTLIYKSLDPFQSCLVEHVYFRMANHSQNHKKVKKIDTKLPAPSKSCNRSVSVKRTRNVPFSCPGYVC